MSTAPKDGSMLPLVRDLPGAIDPLALYSGLSDRGTRTGTFLFESGDGDEGGEIGARSLIGVSCALRIACHGTEVRIEARTANGRSMLPWVARVLRTTAMIVESKDALAARFPEPARNPRYGAVRRRHPSSLDALRAVTVEIRSASAAHDNLCLAAGLFSYDLIDALSGPPGGAEENGAMPLFEFFVPDRLIVVDHRLGRTTLVAHAFGGPGSESNVREAERALEDLQSAASRLGGIVGPPEGPPAALAVGSADSAESDRSDEEFAALVTRLKAYLDRGDIYQIVPSRTFSTPCNDPLAAYGILRSLEPAPYLFFVRAGLHTVLGASPETAVRVSGEPRRVTLRPIAGTAARGIGLDGTLDADLDTRRAAALLLDSKETAEHMMLVDLARNDVARVSRPGTRRVTRLLELERYSRVMHLVSQVEGELADGLDALDAYVAAMNPGTLVGAPKRAAARILRGVERMRRGVYGGAVGYLTRGGRLDTAIVIRAAVVRDGMATVRAGAGVVIDSDPASEAEETRRKAAAVLHAVMLSEVRHA